MNSRKALQQKRIRRARRVRAKISGSQERPRLSVFRSNRFTYGQLIDDDRGHTLISASSREVPKPSGSRLTKTATALAIGELLAKKAIAAGIQTAVFDRGARAYHGRIAAVAEGARKSGLKI